MKKGQHAAFLYEIQQNIQNFQCLNHPSAEAVIINQKPLYIFGVLLCSLLFGDSCTVQLFVLLCGFSSVLWLVETTE